MNKDKNVATKIEEESKYNLKVKVKNTLSKSKNIKNTYLSGSVSRI